MIPFEQLVPMIAIISIVAGPIVWLIHNFTSNEEEINLDDFEYKVTNIGEFRDDWGDFKHYYADVKLINPKRFWKLNIPFWHFPSEGDIYGEVRSYLLREQRLKEEERKKRKKIESLIRSSNQTTNEE